jgi:ParB/RepB/Spo0J family partition protein
MADVKKVDLWKVPFSKLKIETGFNIRLDYGDIQELSGSIRENGVKIPLRGYREGELFVIVDGHRRYRAMQVLFKEGIEISAPFVLEPKNYNPERRVVDMFVTNDGKKLTPLEQAWGISRLVDYGWEDDAIAAAIGKHINYVQRLMGLAASPQKFQDLVYHNKISATLAMDLIQKDRVHSFMAEYEEGKYVPTEDSSNDKPREKKITASALKKANSWGAFKKYAKKNPGDLLPPAKAEFYQFLCRMRRNELTADEIDNYFKI